MSSTTAALLRQVPLFAALDDELREAIALRTRRRTFEAGQALFHEGDPGHTLYVILSGRVNVQRVTPSGEVLHIADRGPGEFVGEMALIDGKPRMADVVTAEACDLLMVDRAAFLECMERSPRIAWLVAGCMVERLREAADHQEKIQSRDVLGRVAGALLELMDLQGTDPVPGGRRLRAQITQQELAERVGTTRESVNRAFRRLKQVGAVQCQGKQPVVTDEVKLRQYYLR